MTELITPSSGKPFKVFGNRERVFMGFPDYSWQQPLTMLPGEAASLARHLECGVGLFSLDDVHHNRCQCIVDRNTDRILIRIRSSFPDRIFDFSSATAVPLILTLTRCAEAAGFKRFVECRVAEVRALPNPETIQKPRWFERLLPRKYVRPEAAK